MDCSEEYRRNACGHTAHYIVVIHENNIEIQNEYEDNCDICKEESVNFRKNIEKRLILCFGD